MAKRALRTLLMKKLDRTSVVGLAVSTHDRARTHVMALTEPAIGNASTATGTNGH